MKLKNLKIGDSMVLADSLSLVKSLSSDLLDASNKLSKELGILNKIKAVK